MKNILLIDSGSGGVNVLRECVKVCPDGNFLLFCDDKNLPYGNKSNEELQKITYDNLTKIRKFFHFDVVVLACNTLTCACIDFCRKKFVDVVFVGTEPAVKPALQKFNESEILVIATPSTIQNSKLLKNSNFKLKCMSNLAGLIDENLDDLSVLKDYLESELGGISCKAIVLGCTHYFAIKDILQEIFPNVEIFDGGKGVARRLKSIIQPQSENFQTQIMTSGDEKLLAKLIYYYFKAE